MKKMSPGEPVFFRLKSPDSAIAGHGFFAHFQAVDRHTSWMTLSWKNGEAEKSAFFERTGGYRHADLLELRATIACADRLHNSSRCDLLAAGEMDSLRQSEGWASNIVTGKPERDEQRAARRATVGDHR